MQVYFVLLGTVLLCAGLLLVYRRLRIAVHGIDAEALVLGPSVSEVDGFTYTATRVGYRTHTGEEMQFTHYAGTPSSLPTGTRLIVRYLPGRPGQQLVRSWAGYCLAPTVILALAGTCFGVAAR